MAVNLEDIAEGRPYRKGAYEFVMHALEFAMGRLDLPRHISGAELLEGIRLYALDEFGPMARHVLAHWGVTETRDFGVIVFDLVSHGVLAKTDEDDLADFEDGFDFETAFETDYYVDFGHPPRSED